METRNGTEDHQAEAPGPSDQHHHMAALWEARRQLVALCEVLAQLNGQLTDMAQRLPVREEQPPQEP